MIEWTEWSKNTITDTHGNLYFYRDLYEGKHAHIFSRAKRLIEQGEIVDVITEGTQVAKNVQTPYIMANISKLIPEIPAMLVSRSIGEVRGSDEVKAFIDEIEAASNLRMEHWSNIVQQQLDGGLVGVPVMDENGLRIDFKQRDVYFPHEDGKGVDLAYERYLNADDPEQSYLHVYRERVEQGNLLTQHMLFTVKETSGELEQVEEDEARELLGMDTLTRIFTGRNKPFIEYWANEKTFMNPLGRSCLVNQEGKQDEINWRLTSMALVFERNGKPRIAVSKEIFQALQDAAMQRYGTASRIDHRDLEITTFDENGRALEVIQIDITKIGNVEWVKDLMKTMLMETSTSEKAVDFYLGDSGQTAESGVAKFYDLFTSIMKAEKIQSEYIYFLQNLFENALWLAREEGYISEIERPDISVRDMIPIAKQELSREVTDSFAKGTQSLDTTVRALHPTASDEWIEEELERLKEEENIEAFPMEGEEA